MTRVLITGDRRWPCLRIAEATCARLRARYGSDLVIVHGACPTGVDAAFEDVARRMKIRTEPHPADWSLGKRAGPIRNRAMCDAGAAFCIACHANLSRSRGTRNCVEEALRRRIPAWWISGNGREPVRVLGFDGFEVRLAEKATA